MNRERIKGLIIKEATQAYKDPSSIITAFVFPLLLLFLYGYGVSLDMDGIRLAVVMEDTSPLARGFLRKLSMTTYLDTRVVANRTEAEAQLTAGKLDGLVVIPSYFSNYFENSDQTAPIQVIADGSAPNTAQFVQNYVRSVWFLWIQEMAIENSEPVGAYVNVIPRVWYNEELLSSHFLVPGSIVVIMTVTGALLTSLVIAREWERGTMEALMATPVTMIEIVVSKFITYFVLGLAAFFLCFLVAKFFYGIPYRGGVISLILSTVTYLTFALGMGLLISISMRDQFAASQIAIVSTYLPAFILSGFIFDIASMPVHLRFLTNFVPARYFVDNLKTQFLVGDVWDLILPNVFYMSLFSVVVYFFIYRKCVKRLD